MGATFRSSRITIDLLEYKQRWDEYCHRHGTTPSEAFRQVVAKLTAPVAGNEQVIHTEIRTAKVRREIRLTPQELAQASAMALREGYSLNRWLTAVVLVRLGAGHQLGQQELEALGRSNLLLLAIGRNLNQIVRAINASGVSGRQVPDSRIAELRALITQHTSTVSLVLAKNIERWRSS